MGVTFQYTPSSTVSTHPQSNCMSNAKLGDVSGPERFEVVRQTDLATSENEKIHIWMINELVKTCHTKKRPRFKKKNVTFKSRFSPFSCHFLYCVAISGILGEVLHCG